VLVDDAQVAHRPLPAKADFVAFSGHKMYAPDGAGALIGPRAACAEGGPFLVGRGAVDLVDLDVVWSPPPEREEDGSPNVLGALALGVAIRELEQIGRAPIRVHDTSLARKLRAGLTSIPGVRPLGPGFDAETLPITAHSSPPD
jgi:selenocysteine lyase/cysteine desulfurase